MLIWLYRCADIVWTLCWLCLWLQGETGSSGENGVPGAMVCDYRWHLKSMNSSLKWCHSSHISSSVCLFQGARGLPGERGRPGPPGPSVSVTSMHYCLCGVENKTFIFTVQYYIFTSTEFVHSMRLILYGLIYCSAYSMQLNSVQINWFTMSNHL